MNLSSAPRSTFLIRVRDCISLIQIRVMGLYSGKWYCDCLTVPTALPEDAGKRETTLASASTLHRLAPPPESRAAPALARDPARRVDAIAIAIEQQRHHHGGVVGREAACLGGGRGWRSNPAPRARCRAPDAPGGLPARTPAPTVAGAKRRRCRRSRQRANARHAFEGGCGPVAITADYRTWV